MLREYKSFLYNTVDFLESDTYLRSACVLVAHFALTKMRMTLHEKEISFL